MAHFEFTVRYTTSIVRSSVRRYYLFILRSELGWRLYLAVATLVAVLAYDLAARPATWFDGAVGAILVVAILAVVAGYSAHTRQGMEKLRLTGDGSARFVLTDDSLIVTSQGGSATLPWVQFERILPGADSWILVLTQRSMMTIPLAGVDNLALEFMRNKIVDHGRDV